MSWFSRFRRRGRTEDYVGRHRPGSWGEIALPPFEVVIAAVTAPEPTITTAPAPAVVAEPIPEPAAFEHLAVAPRQRVRLGFADGSTHDVDGSSTDAETFRAVADRLLGSVQP